MHKCLFLAAIGGILLAQSALTPALADTRDEVWSAMQRCRAIQDDRAWLDCNYGAQQPMRARLGLAPAPDFQQRLVPPQSMTSTAMSTAAMPPAGTIPKTPAPLPHRSPSFMQILTGRAQPVAVSSLASVEYDSQGAFIVTLGNGQVWHQLDSDFSAKARFKIGAKTTVTPGALGSYTLKADGTSHVYKVERRT